MRFLQLLAAGILAPVTVVSAPASDPSGFLQQYKRENLCNLKSPPSLCQPNSSVTVAETALRAYKFYRAFVVDGDPRTMFSLIDSSYIVRYNSGPQTIWSLFCNGNKIGTEASTAWCFDASTNMSYARYSTTDRWRWVDGCVHEHWDQGEKIPTDKCYKLNTTSVR
ncbi:hypothetical protein CONLIGDRAFT_572143 [Coniochaeta ligniaria NRRL 30616]|uniref:AA1-like domain-containing protein n=1 Tax=Coniochaeta ligniaria NRRL 30616 TaxID=1408157 RepID=A0A1J7IX07_9PEZI|nr:hypothetical protein CONLIGDRAFT_572143 [Coniochaeta ligniaria NRRL 30616]